MKLFMCPLFGLDAMPDMSYTQMSLKNWVGKVMKRTEKKSGKFPNNFDVTAKASDEVIEDANHDQVVWNAEDEEESSESPGEDRDKTMITMWDAVIQPKEFGSTVCPDDYSKKVSNSDA